jgi:membrane-bound lytic murein transglycosylase D
MKNKIIILFLFLSLHLYASLTFDNHISGELDVLKTFDVETTYIYDKKFNNTIDRYSNKKHTKRFFSAMNNGYLFLPHIKELIANSSVPDAFLYLAMAESNFKTRAYSHKSASGIWQFMSETGRIYGLHIDQYVDERRDLIKATKSAIRYLESLHNSFDKWYLAAIAYNCGQTRVEEALSRAILDKYVKLYPNKLHNKKIKYYYSIIRKYQRKRVSYVKLHQVYLKLKDFNISISLSELLHKQRIRREYLPRESRNYIRKILTFALMGSSDTYMMKKEFDYLFNRGQNYSLAKVKVARGDTLSRISKLIKINLKELRTLNSHLKYDFMPPYSPNYEIYIPYIKLSSFNKNYTKPDNSYYVFHKVKRGDNLSKIAEKYHISYRIIKDFNRLRNNLLSINQKLVIPIGKKYKRHYKYRSKKKVRIIRYRVRNGDNLYNISRRYGVSVKKIKKINHLRKDMLRTKQILKIPLKVSYNILKNSDSLFAISKKYSTKISLLKYRSSLGRTKLKVGDRLIVAN